MQGCIIIYKTFDTGAPAPVRSSTSLPNNVLRALDLTVVSQGLIALQINKLCCLHLYSQFGSVTIKIMQCQFCNLCYSSDLLGWLVVGGSNSLHFAKESLGTLETLFSQEAIIRQPYRDMIFSLYTILLYRQGGICGTVLMMQRENWN